LKQTLVDAGLDPSPVASHEKTRQGLKLPGHTPRCKPVEVASHEKTRQGLKLHRPPDRGKSVLSVASHEKTRQGLKHKCFDHRPRRIISCKPRKNPPGIETNRYMSHSSPHQGLQATKKPARD